METPAYRVDWHKLWSKLANWLKRGVFSDAPGCFLNKYIDACNYPTEFWWLQSCLLCIYFTDRCNQLGLERNGDRLEHILSWAWTGLKWLKWTGTRLSRPGSDFLPQPPLLLDQTSPSPSVLRWPSFPTTLVLHCRKIFPPRWTSYSFDPA